MDSLDNSMWGSQEQHGAFIGPLRVLRKLGSGAMGDVYLAQDVQRNGQLCAVKVLGEAFAFDEEAHARFQREIEAQAKVSAHPGIVQIFHAGRTANNHPYFAMEVIEGHSLEDLAKAGLGPQGATEIVAQVASALAFAHERGLTHRDVKPENVMVDEQGRAKLTDFGLAKAANRGQADRLTRTGEILGTPAFMAPEQVSPLDYGEAGPHTDVYALGAMTYYLLTNEVPHSGNTSIDIYSKIGAGDRAVPLRKKRPDAWGARLGKVIDRALSPKPTDRYPNAGAFAQAFSDALNAQATAPHKGLLIGLSLVALLAVSGVVALATTRARDSAPETEASLASHTPEEVRDAWAKGDLEGALAMVAGLSAPTPEAAWVLAASGELERALQAARGTKDPETVARIAAWAGGADALAAWREVRSGLSADRAWALASELGLEPPGGHLPTEGTWATLARAERWLAAGDLPFALDLLAELEVGPVPVRAAAALTRVRAELARCEVEAAGEAWAAGWKLCGAADTVLRARYLAWAKYLSAVATSRPDPTREGEELSALETPDELGDAVLSDHGLSAGLPLTLLSRALLEDTPTPAQVNAAGLRTSVDFALAQARLLVSISERGRSHLAYQESVGSLAQALSAVQGAARLGGDPVALATLALRAERRLGDRRAAKELLEGLPEGPHKALLEAEFAHQAGDRAALRSDLTLATSTYRLDDKPKAELRARRRETGEAAALLLRDALEVARAAVDASPQEPARSHARLRTLAVFADLDHRLHAAKMKLTKEERREAYRLAYELAGTEAQIATVVSARAALAKGLIAGDAASVRAAEVQARDAVRAWEGQRPAVPVAVQRQALRLLGHLGRTQPARAYHLIAASLPARARLNVERANLLKGAEQVAVLKHAETLSLGGSFAATYALELTRLPDAYAASEANLRALAEVALARPAWADEVIATLSLAQADLPDVPPPADEDDRAGWLASAFAAARGPKPTSERLRLVASRARRAFPEPAALFLRGLALAKLSSGKETPAVNTEARRLVSWLRTAEPTWPLGARLELCLEGDEPTSALIDLLCAGHGFESESREGEEESRVFSLTLRKSSLVSCLRGAGLFALSPERALALAERIWTVTSEDELPKRKRLTTYFPVVLAALCERRSYSRDVEGLMARVSGGPRLRMWWQAVYAASTRDERKASKHTLELLWSYPLGGSRLPLDAPEHPSEHAPRTKHFGGEASQDLVEHVRPSRAGMWHSFLLRRHAGLREELWQTGGEDEEDPFKRHTLRRLLGGGSLLQSPTWGKLYDDYVEWAFDGGHVAEARLHLDVRGAFPPDRWSVGLPSLIKRSLRHFDRAFGGDHAASSLTLYAGLLRETSDMIRAEPLDWPEQHHDFVFQTQRALVGFELANQSEGDARARHLKTAQDASDRARALEGAHNWSEIRTRLRRWHSLRSEALRDPRSDAAKEQLRLLLKNLEDYYDDEHRLLRRFGRLMRRDAVWRKVLDVPGIERLIDLTDPERR